MRAIEEIKNEIDKLNMTIYFLEMKDNLSSSEIQKLSDLEARVSELNKELEEAENNDR